MKYKVAMRGGRWKYGFSTLEAASAYAEQIRRRTGVFVAIEAYQTRRKA